MEHQHDKDKGYNCPACTLYVKRYKRSFNANMAAALLAFHKHSGGRFVHLEDFLAQHGHGGANRCGDAAKLVLFGLLEKMPGARKDGSKRNGYYRITDKGHQFATGNITVPSHFFMFNNRLDGFTGEPVTIGEALREKFNYRELM